MAAGQSASAQPEPMEASDQDGFIHVEHVVQAQVAQAPVLPEVKVKNEPGSLAQGENEPVTPD